MTTYATRIKALGERGVTPGLGTILVGDDPNSHAYVRLKRENSRGDRYRVPSRRAPRHRGASRGPRGHRELQPRSRGRRLPRAGPAAEGSRRGSGAERGRPGEGRGRPASGEPRPPRHGCACAAAVHAARHPGAARALRRAHRAPARRDCRSRSHDRSSAREPALAQGAERQRHGHHLSHRHVRPRRAHDARPTSSWRPRDARRSSLPKW